MKLRARCGWSGHRKSQLLKRELRVELVRCDYRYYHNYLSQTGKNNKDLLVSSLKSLQNEVNVSGLDEIVRTGEQQLVPSSQASNDSGVNSSIKEKGE